ncbi:hypothetical protein HN807_00980 [Candidatus Bathyarchaeota archaeon]|jgi:hypothetical protein|nr:hypothetical protein [Candidatus Bathyarchaeota archaeon]MBT4319686.1 hypothetical protein [Candidatus Bathyarchaeota archaeon]MBT4424631.1 hypothetical protein [Candidatus Bathyarchaeota archaeon]MBT6604063.1 hypothetical protein [Candidatus Bathyarchaeota archaeon]MBT7187388.1 hypothetical protein [Candidatus Bathyarchaeota archaeon]
MSELESVINLCLMVQSGKIEPFDIDFDYVMSVIKKNYPNLKNVQEFCLDAQALKELSNVLERQNQWIEHQSTTLYKDPFMLSQSLMGMDIGAIANAFLRSWHPLMEMEQISTKTLAGSLSYWGGLIPFDERWQDCLVEERETEYASMDEAIELGFIPGEGFTEVVENFWKELGERVGPGGIIEYWEWIGEETYEATVYRAYLTVFMVGYGYANAHWDRLMEENKIIHNVEPRPDPGQQKVSIPTMVDYEEWKQWQND